MAPVHDELTRAAADLQLRIQAVLKSPAMMLLGVPAKEAIRDLSRMVHTLAVEVDKCKAGIQ